MEKDEFFQKKEILLKDITKELPFYFGVFFKFFASFFNLLKAVRIIFNLESLVLNKKSNWLTTQIFHSILDTINVNKNKNFKISNIKKFKIILKSLYELKIANILIKSFNFRYAFIGNSVYYSRIYVAVFRDSSINVINHAQYGLYIQPKKRDSSWGEINEILYNKINKKIKKIDFNNYFKLRSKGQGIYEDSKSSFKGKLKSNNELNHNFIFLHVFKDSPFHIIDRRRIFVDYFDWIKKTISIIKNSEEKWFLKIHPSARAWGEDSKKFLDSINYKSKNISIVSNHLSNNLIFRNAKRIITFSGTSYLESIAYGIKPIIISEPPTFSKFSKNVFKPRNFEEYNFLLSKNLNTNYFRQKNSSINDKAKKIIYIREKILTNLKDFDGYLIYKNTSSKRKNLLRELLKKNLSNREHLFENYLDTLLKFNHSISLKSKNKFL